MNIIVDWQLISHSSFLSLSLLFSVYKLVKCQRGSTSRGKWKEHFLIKDHLQSDCFLSGSHWASQCEGGFTLSLSHPVCRSVKWTCRLLNTYRNEENMHVPKQRHRTHQMEETINLSNIYKMQMWIKNDGAVPEHLLPCRLTKLLFTTCLLTHSPLFLNIIKKCEFTTSLTASTACWVALLHATCFFSTTYSLPISVCVPFPQSLTVLTSLLLASLLSLCLPPV